MEGLLKTVRHIHKSQHQHAATKSWIQPAQRSRCIRAMCCSYTRDFGRVAQDMPCTYKTHHFDFCRAVERVVFETSCLTSQYAELMYSIAFCMAMNGDSIVDRYQPHEVPLARENDLMSGHILDRVRCQQASHEQVFQDMLQERYASIANRHDAGDGDMGLLQCETCKTYNVVWEQRQTRSADEGMSVYAMCMSCKRRWVES